MKRSVDYDRIAPSYERRYRDNNYSGIERALLDFVGDDASLRVLEVGCGTGHWLALLIARGFDVAGLDASERMLAAAREQAPAAQLVHGRAEQLPWSADCFDRVVCINAFHHFSDKPVFIAEASRVLRPGGRLLSVGLDPHTGLDSWSIYDYFVGTLEIDKRRYPPAQQIRAWLSEAGFSDCRTDEVQHMPMRIEAREALASGRLDKTVTSQLSVLTDAEYAAGIRRIEQQILASAAAGAALYLGADLRVYGTTGQLIGERESDRG